MSARHMAARRPTKPPKEAIENLAMALEAAEREGLSQAVTLRVDRSPSARRPSWSVWLGNTRVWRSR